MLEVSLIRHTQIQEPKGVESGGETSKVCSAGMLQEQDWESPLWAISAKRTMTSHEIYYISLNSLWMASRGKPRHFSMTDSRRFVAQGQQSRQLCPVRFCSSNQLRPLLSCPHLRKRSHLTTGSLCRERETLLFSGDFMSLFTFWEAFVKRA